MEFKKEPFENFYEVGEDIGSGQFAIVRKARHRETDVEYAAKFIRKKRGGGRRGAKMEDIQREVNILSMIDHPNIIHLLEVYETRTEVILVLELVSGGELFDYISEKDHLSEEEASTFIKQILEAVQHLHSKSIAHLDLKPENIMLLNKNSCRIKLIDFGLSQVITPKSDIRAMMGTAEFIAPEVVSYDPLSLATDMWSIGVITYILLSGASPFLGDEQQETYENITSVTYAFDDEYFNGTSELAKDFIRKTFIKESRKRATVTSCMQHPWIQPLEKKQSLTRKTSVINIEQFKKLMARKRWKQSVRIVSLCTHLSRSVRLRKSQSLDTNLTDSKDVIDEQEKAENFVMAALFCASEEGNVEGLKELVGMAQNIDLTTANRHGETAVHMAASGGHTEVLKFLQAKGVDVSIQDKNGDSAVYWAARQGHLDVLRHLKDENVPLDSQNKSGESALHVAARYGHAAVVDFLCSAGTNVNLQDNLGETALHSASWHGFLRIVTSLCSAGAKIDAENKEGETALHNASARGYLDVVKTLLEYGAPVNQMDKRGGTALYLASNRRHSNIAMVLLHAGCEMDIVDKESGDCALHCAAREGLTAVVQTMCAFGCQVDIISQDGFTPLHLSCKHGHTEIVRCLLLAGARPEITNKDGVTSEIMALAQGFTDIAELVNKVKRDRAGNFVTQLIPSSQPLSRIKLKVLGSTGVGKSTLVETLKCGLFSGLFRRSRLTSQASTDSHKGRPRLPRQYSLPTPLCYSVSNPIYTKGINVQQVSISGIGDVSLWDFSGYEPYYMLYDHFLGDSNCLHIIVFSLTDTYDEQIAQVQFWLGFLKSRVPPHVPIGHCGRLPNIPKVLLVATHADKVGCHKNARGEYVCPTASRVLAKAQLKFASDINFVERVFIMDANVAMSNDIKALKQQIGDIRSQIIGELPRSNGFLDAMVAQLPSWRRSSSSFPVLSWTQFVEYVRAKINPLAGDDHMKILVEELQLIGEIVYLECDSSQDLVILHPKWLCEDIIGNLISQEKIIQSRITGCFTVDDFQLMYPETDALDLLQVLEALEVCTQCDNEGEIEYEFPCLNFIETLNGLWQKDSKRFGSAVYGGVRIQTDPDLGGQLKHIFARIQVCLRHNVLQESEDPEAELYQWHHGSKYCCGEMEGLLGMDRHEQHLDIKVRGPAESRTQLFYFLEDFMHVVEQTALNVCPALCLERHLSSCLNLKDHSKTVHAFSPLHIMRAQRNKSNCVQLPDSRTEDLADLMFLGSLEVVQNVTLGIDLPISHLTVHTRRILSSMLDPPEPMGRDWCLLAVTLGLQNLLPGLDNTSTPVTESKTDRVLLEWSKVAPQCTIGQLVGKLLEFNREDVVEMVLRTSPLFKVMMYEDHSTDDSTIPPPTTASTNTLSNLSR